MKARCGKGNQQTSNSYNKGYRRRYNISKPVAGKKRSKADYLP